MLQFNLTGKLKKYAALCKPHRIFKLSGECAIAEEMKFLKNILIFFMFSKEYSLLLKQCFSLFFYGF